MKHLLPILDDLERALEAAEQHEEAKLEEGVALVHRALADLLRRQGLEEIETAAASTRTSTRRCSPSRPKQEEGSVIQVAQKGYRLGDLVLRPARVIVSAGPRGDEWLARLYETLGVRRRRDRGRDQEGVPQARAREPPRPQPRRQGRGGAVQGGAERVRHALRPGEAQAVRHVRLGERPRSARRRPGATRNFDFGDLGDFLGGMFSGGRRRQRQRPRGMRGADIEAEVRLSFDDSLKGVETRIPVEVETACSECGGTGAKPGHVAEDLPRVQRARRPVREPGPVRALAAVPALPRQRHRDRGSVPALPRLGPRAADEALHGQDPGRRQGRHAHPAEGQGRGRLGGGPPGDLYVVTRVEPSPLYERRGADLVVNVPVTYAEAALGASVEVPTPEGAVSLKVPAGSEDGKLLRIRGRGAPKLNGSGRGDVLARVRVSVPKKLSKRERELLEELQKVSGENPREGLVA